MTEYSWLAFIAVTTVNAIVIKVRTRKYISEKPLLEDGYNKCVKYIVVFGNIPWIIMGMGHISGITNTTSDYF